MLGGGGGRGWNPGLGSAVNCLNESCPSLGLNFLTPEMEQAGA